MKPAVPSWKRVKRLVAGVVCALLCACVLPVLGWEDDCVVTGNLGDTSSRGRARALANTAQTGCADTSTRVWARITGGIQFECESGEEWQTSCYNSSPDANALVTVGASVYGYWDATSSHEYTRGGTSTTLTPRRVTLNAGKSDEEECEDAGNHWTGEYCELAEQQPPESPIIVATGSSSYHLTSAQEGVLFDIDGDGALERVAWTKPGAEIAFLAIDVDGDGRIGSGKELFGNSTMPGVSNGFAALAEMAQLSNGGVRRGSVSEDDPLFARLLLWTDANHNGVSEPAELRPAQELLSDIGLGWAIHHRKDGNGNEYRLRGWVHYRTRPGRNRAESEEEDIARRRQIFDVFLATIR